jgi:hypothetical protein
MLKILRRDTSPTSTTKPETRRQEKDAVKTVDDTEVSTSAQQRAEVIRQARALGADNLPSSNDPGPSPIEQEVIDGALARIRRATVTLTKAIGVKFRLINTTAIVEIDPRLIAASAATAMARTKVEHGGRLCQSRMAERKAARDLAIFREANGLTREAAYAPSSLYAFAWLVVLILLEAAGNCAIFAAGSDVGLLGGVLLASLFSVINVGLGFAAGLIGLRLIGHVEKRRVRLGWISLVVLVALGLGFNLMVAVFRNGLGGGRGAADGGLSGVVMAFALCILGVAIFIVSMMKGRGGRGCPVDAYWAYRAADLNHKEQLALYEEHKAEYRREADANYDGLEAELAAVDAQNAARLTGHRDAEGDIDLQLIETKAHAANQAEDAHQLLREFRGINGRIRTDPAPAYFADYPEFPMPGRDTVELDALNAAVRESEAAHRANQAVLADLRLTLAQRRTSDIEGFLAEVDQIETRADHSLLQDTLAGLAVVAKTGEAGR